jgi:phosphatidylserine/phosphatidylglycerophosphate/cardiolipin synthase-like enzyme
MTADQDRLLIELQHLATALPVELVETVAAAIEQTDTGDWTYAQAHVMRTLAQPAYQAHVHHVFQAWKAHSPGLTPASVALALRAASLAEAQHRLQQAISLVWTGPDSRIIPLRRTNQALLQLIQSAHKRLLIVSFAVYRAHDIAHALVEAAQRGVVIRLCLETPEAGEGKIAYDTLRALGPAVAECARVFAWPLDQRPQLPDGRHGSLHAKVAVADGHCLLLSSANLTEYAMTLNMELGVMIEGDELPGQVEQHFERLIEMGILKPMAFE